jgi:HEPN domain-containing protein
MPKSFEEWLKQADYDMDTARYMFKGGRFVYAVFMCHLAVEKALKGVYQLRMKEIPPKTHNLVGLLDRMGIKPPETLAKSIVRLNDTHVTTRYPDDLARILQFYPEPVTSDLMKSTAGILEWIKTQHSK